MAMKNCTVDEHNRWATISSSAGTNLRLCTSNGCPHIILNPRGAGGSSDNHGKHKHSPFIDKAQIAERAAHNKRSQQIADRTVKVLTANGKLRRVRLP